MINNEQVVLLHSSQECDGSTAGPVDTLGRGLLESSNWECVKFVSEKEVIKEMAGQSLAPGIGPKLMANFTCIMRYALGSKDPDPKDTS